MPAARTKLLEAELPLQSRTPDSWAQTVLQQPLALLNDHAYLEKKAALNALDLLNRWPEPVASDRWLTTLTGIARDETVHLDRVLRLLQRRGGVLERTHKNPYANELRLLVRRGRNKEELLDRLLVSALIEARSCERFGVLGRCAKDKELAQLYRGLWASEFSHHTVFLKIAREVLDPDAFESRWSEMLIAEARILAAQSPGPRMHSGPQYTTI